MIERKRLLDQLGVTGDVADELLAYTENPYAVPGAEQRHDWPMADERHIERWLTYERDTASLGAFEVLKGVFPQLRFPIRSGMSQNPRYRAATRRGELSAATGDAGAGNLVLRQPERLELAVVPSAGGRIPVIVSRCREDFVALVQALTERNEPVPVPASMGACLVKGLTNWDRVAQYRARWERTHGTSGDAEAWARELPNFSQRTELYQDRFVLLSDGPYSSVAAAQIGMPDEEWLARSLVIRREHELTHYFTWRRFGFLRSHATDELVADFIGLTRAFGEYSGALARRCLGLEAYPSYRTGGRLEHYCGKPPLSPRAFDAVTLLVSRATDNLEAVGRRQLADFGDPGSTGRLIHALISSGLEELAADDLLGRVAQRMKE